jgi:hypothetical protein
MQRRLAKITAFAIVFSLLATAGIALAATKTMNSNHGSTDGTNFPDQHSFGTHGRAIGDIADRYTTHMNHWNPKSNGPTQITFDNADINAGYTLSVFDPAAAIFQGIGAPGADAQGFVDPIHAPANYPFVMKGCHWGTCSTGLVNDFAVFPGLPDPTTDPEAARIGAGGPLPIRVDKLKSLVSTWDIALGGNSGAASPTAVWDAAFDIWFDTNMRGELPGNPAGLNQQNLFGGTAPGSTTNGLNGGQNDGTELMIWLNNRGYNRNGGTTFDPNNPITPAGHLVAQLNSSTIPGAPDRYDVWVNRSGDANDPNVIKWNVITFVRVNANGTAPNATAMDNIDILPFINFATTNVFIANNGCPGLGANDPYVTAGAPCLASNWWLTSVQVGFEVWRGGQGLATTKFSTLPKTDENVSTGRLEGANGTTPFINWMYPFVVRYEAPCQNATVTYAINPDTANGGTGIARPAVTMKKVQENDPTAAGVNLPSDHFAIVPHTHINAPNEGNSLHGPLNVVFHVTGCTVNPPDKTVPMFIDPSGRVLSTINGIDISVQGANVTLQRSLNPGGPFTAVPDHNAGLPVGQEILGPSNLTNPDKTGSHGEYGWTTSNVTAFYRVIAQKDGCGPAVTSPVVVVPPAVTGLDIHLACTFSTVGQPGGPSETGGNSGGGGSNLPTQVTVYNDWGAGYCAYFVVTNNTSAPVNWVTTFTMPRAGTIFNKWNFNFTRSGNQITAQGDAAWDTTLQAGQSLIPFNHGFCANTP